MKSGLEVVNDIYHLLNVNQVLESIDGKVFQFTRSPGRKQTDIVVNLISATNTQIQEAIVNVNLYVPNLTTDTTAPDLYNLNKLASLITPVVDQQFKLEFFTKIDRPAMIIRDTDGGYFANIRVHYYSIQTNFKNI